MSTISAVLYANQNHPELKIEFPNWPDRYKQIMKKWRALAPDMKQPYLQRARDNRSAQQAQLRTKKAQQVIMVIFLNFFISRIERINDKLFVALYKSFITVMIHSEIKSFEVIHNLVICKLTYLTFTYCITLCSSFYDGFVPYFYT